MSQPTTHPTAAPAGVTAPDRALLAIVPARGGSKGVPFKNMRRLGDRPLIAYTVEAVVAAGVADRVVISSDFDQALRWAELNGHEIHERPEALAGDEATISDMAADLATSLGWTGDVGVFQPTSPLRSSDSIARAVEAFRASDADSMASAVRERHLFWLDEEDDLARARPLFESRVNRQYAKHRVLRETGSIQLVRAAALAEGGQMVTDRHVLFEVPPDEALDIDTRGGPGGGSPPARTRHRGVPRARERGDRLGARAPLPAAGRRAGRPARALPAARLRPVRGRAGDRARLRLRHRDRPGHRPRAACDDPGRRVLVNDVLDTTEEEVLLQRSLGFKVVNIEDLGPGAKVADWVVNALYPNDQSDDVKVASGPRVRDAARRVLQPAGQDHPRASRAAS